MSSSRFSLRWLLVFVGMTTVLARADDDLGERGTAANQLAERPRVVNRVAVAEVRRLKVGVGEDRPVAAVLRPESLLRWSNPTVGSIYGEVFLWTIGDRPIPIASIYHRFDRPSGWDLELVSTSELPLRATDGPETLWETGPGIDYRPLDD